MNDLQGTIELLRKARERFARARETLKGNDPEELNLLDTGIGIIMARMAILKGDETIDSLTLATGDARHPKP